MSKINARNRTQTNQPEPEPATIQQVDDVNMPLVFSSISDCSLFLNTGIMFWKFGSDKRKFPRNDDSHDGSYIWRWRVLGSILICVSIADLLRIVTTMYHRDSTSTGRIIMIVLFNIVYWNAIIGY